MDQSFIPLKIRELDGLTVFPFELWIRLASNKLVCVARRGEDIDRTRIARYLEKGLDYLLVRDEDYRTFSAKKNKVIADLMNHPAADFSTKLNLLSKQADIVFSSLRLLGFQSEHLEQAQEVQKNTQILMSKNPSLLQLLESLSFFEDKDTTHSLSAGIIATMIAKSQGWIHQSNFEKLNLGGLLHDIGVKYLPPHIQNVSESTLNPEDLELFKSHPVLGRKALSQIAQVPKEVLIIAEEHHEGLKGYPLKKRDEEVHPLAKVVALADHFAYLTLGYPGAEVKKVLSPLEAFSVLQTKYRTTYRREDLQALNKALASLEKAS